jgi:hypothetical protein
VRSAWFRTASRIFATLLLAWTTADLCGHGLCVHDREPLVPIAPAAPGQPETITAPDGGEAGAHACNGPDDCFCCCHCVEVQARFRIPLVYTVVSALFFERSSLSDLPPSPLYHPPLA